MNEQSLNRLSDYFADAVHAKIKSKSQMDLLIEESLAISSTRALETDKVLFNALVDGSQLDEELVKYVIEQAAQKRLLATEGWTMPELNLRCDNVRVLSMETENTFALGFKVTLEKCNLFFCCQANANKVYKHGLFENPEEMSDIDDAWEYYFQHTPCAIA